MHPRQPIGRTLAHWLVPGGVRDAHRALRKRLRERRLGAIHREVLAVNEDLRDRHAGRRCFVIGNGPSLARHDLSPLADEITFAASGFWKHPIVERWQPTYYCFADPLFFDGTEATRQFFDGLRAHVRRSTFFVPVEARALVEQGLLPSAQTRYVTFGSPLSDGLKAPPDLTRPTPSVVNVVLLSILVAMYTGCSPIYLVGLDHDWLAHRGPDRHFYGGHTIENHPEVRQRLADYSYRHLMECQLELWRSYEALGAWATGNGTQILNASDGGFLDVFERVPWAEVVRAAPPA